MSQIQKNTAPIKVKSNKQNKKPVKSRRGRRARRRQNRVPAAYVSTVSNFSKIISSKKPHISGRESFPINLTGSNSVVKWAIPFCPVRWSGTRTSVLLATYSTYRPISVRLSYQPAVGTTTDGFVSIGTVFGGTTLDCTTVDQVMTSLASTNGGFSCSVYRPHYSNINLGTNLTQNTYPTSSIDPDDIPFWILVSWTADKQTIGYLVIDYVIGVHNPITVPTELKTTIPVSVSISHDESENTSELHIPMSHKINNISQGADYWFFPFNCLYNLTGNIISKIGQAVHATLITEGVNNQRFTIDPQYNTINNIGMYFGGSSLNFQ